MVVLIDDTLLIRVLELLIVLIVVVVVTAVGADRGPVLAFLAGSVTKGIFLAILELIPVRVLVFVSGAFSGASLPRQNFSEGRA